MSVYTYTTREIWVRNGGMNIFGIAYIPDINGKMPLVIFSHELGHTTSARTSSPRTATWATTAMPECPPPPRP